METNETITITLCDCAENHVGMEKIGVYADDGFTLDDLMHFRDVFSEMGANCTIIDLNHPIEDQEIYPDDEAYILVIKNGIDFLLGDNGNNELFEELRNLKWDKKAKMYGRVVNKHARHNLCFASRNRKPDYQNGKGRIIAFDDVPLLAEVKNRMADILDCELVAEGNYYYDVSKCGISGHGDTERKKVIGLRIGASMPLVFQWFYQGNPVGENIRLEFDHGDIYIMNEKATGNDWKCKSKYTLRHAAGAEKYLKIKQKN